jgi:hypothetical protein
MIEEPPLGLATEIPGSPAAGAVAWALATDSTDAALEADEGSLGDKETLDAMMDGILIVVAAFLAAAAAAASFSTNDSSVTSEGLSINGASMLSMTAGASSCGGACTDIPPLSSCTIPVDISIIGWVR